MSAGWAVSGAASGWAVVGAASGSSRGWPLWVGVAGAVVATVPAGARWLRVSQREHYLPGAASRFALRWGRARAVNVLLVAISAVGVVLAVRWPVAALLTALAVSAGPVGLGVRGRTAPLAFTRRLKLQSALWAVVQGAIVVVGALVGLVAPLAAAGAVLVPLAVDGAAGVLAPLEGRLARRHVARAAARLRHVAPRIVGITGSFGKTSTKNHLHHLLGTGRAVVASPASFNNRAGLARAVNENLAEGTEVFIAEMGTYGPGEIAELCSWCPPEVAVITAIGPVHLERFGSEERIVAAKAEIVGPASVVVVNADDPRLAAVAAAAGRGPRAVEVVRCSGVAPVAGASATPADIAVVRTGGTVSVWIGRRRVAEGVAVAPGIQAGNLACAIGAALHLGMVEDEVLRRIGDLPAVPSRLVVGRAPSGVTVLDDTFNSNPAGARAALDALASLGVAGRRIVVTPGMVEMGRRQRAENTALGRQAAAVADGVIVVGRTNRRTLLQGAGGAVISCVDTREEALGWVRTELGEGDAVLYENDLPDHYP